jgi:hypothetical protein
MLPAYEFAGFDVTSLTMFSARPKHLYIFKNPCTNLAEALSLHTLPQLEARELPLQVLVAE